MSDDPLGPRCPSCGAMQCDWDTARATVFTSGPALMARIAALVEIVREGCCPANTEMTIADCVDRKECGCSMAMLLS